MKLEAKRAIAGLPRSGGYAFRGGSMLRSFVALALLSAPVLAAEPFAPYPPLSSAPVQTPTPFTALLDLDPARAAAHGEAERSSYPIWLEAVEYPPSSSQGERLVRLRLRSLPALTDRLLLRLFFFDRIEEGSGPVVTGWSETGEQRYSSGPLGLGLGLPASESLAIEAEAIDYLEITVPADPEGRVLRQALIATLKPSERLEVLDLSAIASLADPFRVEQEVLGEEAPDEDEDTPTAPAAFADQEADTFLFGRTRAVLHPAPVRLAPGSEGTDTVHFTFTLGSAPLLAMATFTLHHADPAAPIQAWINGEPIGSIAVELPDLADPGYIATADPSGTTRFRYAGWLRARIAFPGRQLRSGTNTLSLQLPEGAAPTVLHRLELQLKGHWPKLHYTLEPR